MSVWAVVLLSVVAAVAATSVLREPTMYVFMEVAASHPSSRAAGWACCVVTCVVVWSPTTNRGCGAVFPQHRSP
jgi:hypothetical protein